MTMKKNLWTTREAAKTARKTVKALSPEQKAALREMLRKHFNLPRGES
jgi:hypothetical protein